MWIFTRWGFLSIVQHNAMPGYFQVKARVIDPLEHLWPEHEIEIIDWADYRFRITIEKERTTIDDDFFLFNLIDRTENGTVFFVSSSVT